jgi:hypothetical protein
MESFGLKYGCYALICACYMTKVLVPTKPVC